MSALVAADDVILAAILTTKTLKLSVATGSLGAEYWGAFKNVTALACDVVDGL